MKKPAFSIDSLRRLLFLQALAGADEAGLFLGKLLLGRAVIIARKGKAPHERPDALGVYLEDELKNRKHLVIRSLYQRHPALFPLVAGLCFLAGAGANYLGPSTQVNLLLNPLMVLFVWNFLIYLLLLLPKRFSPAGALQHLFQAPLQKLNTLFSLPHGPWDSDAGGRDILVKARLSFQRLWWHQGGTMLRPQLIGRIHLCAAALVAGVVMGLYLRGLVQAYQFTWSSTFIQDEATLTRILGIFYGPALLIGKPLFPQGLPAIDPGQGPQWIHLLAFSALVYIILPRILLTLWSYGRAAKAAAGLRPDLNVPFFLELMQDEEQRRIGFFFYSYHPAEPVLQRLVKAARTCWGSGLQFDEPRQIAWGETEFPVRDWPAGSIWLLGFNGVQTPESDVHGDLVADLLEKAGKSNIRVAVVVDAARVAGESRTLRQLAWEKVLGLADRYAWIDLDMESPEQVTALSRSVWSRES